MMTAQWLGVPYLPPEKVKPPPPEMLFEHKVFLFVLFISLLSLAIIGLAKLLDRWAERKRRARHKDVNLKFKRAIVPGWVFRDKDSMRLWLRMDLGVEPEQFHVDMLMALYEARVNAMKRASIGKGYTLVQIKEKIINGEDK